MEKEEEIERFIPQTGTNVSTSLPTDSDWISECIDSENEESLPHNGEITADLRSHSSSPESTASTSSRKKKKMCKK